MIDRFVVMTSLWRRRLFAFAGPFVFATASAFAQPSTHPVHPVMPDQRLYVRLQSLEGRELPTVQVPIDLTSASMQADLNQTVSLPVGGGVVLRRFLPQASLEQVVSPVEGGAGKPACEISIEGPTQSFRRWLMADDPERNRLSSFIGTWRFMAVAGDEQRDSLYRQFETEFTRDPLLVVNRRNGERPQTLEVRPDARLKVDDVACEIRVLRFFPDYAKTEHGSEPVNRSDRRRNPAAEVEVSWDGQSTRRWVFAKFPEFAAKDGDSLPVHFSLDCAVEGTGDAPDFVIVNVGGERLEAWSRHKEKTSRGPLTVREHREIIGSQYRFQVANFVTSAKLTEEYRPADKGKGAAALQIEYTDSSGADAKVWLGMGESRSIATKSGPLSIAFVTKGPDQPGGHP